MAEKRQFKDKNMQLIIGWLLRLGVGISMLIVLAGGILYLWRHQHSHSDYSTFKGVPQFVHPRNIIASILAGKGQAMIQAGIIFLIATPVMRVIFSAIGFILERDRLYTAISILVLLVILTSMLSGHAG
ncbi:putative membrane protein [Mucilaginibacter yixingensis]|uniref:Putative membrane protein n=1 Tax=Mucilaginibacter yixingensis TaxID=1295612 RepID=A0A2T5J6B0_9SPHI|nr:DUF1634 domain-containing protein [Mucilaginibacter yixingensis]PTQ94073.1 putative membrane protein [Mucilaginibacter yixingensis]